MLINSAMTRVDGQNETLGCDMRHIFEDDECYPMRQVNRCFSMETSSFECPALELGSEMGSELLSINGTMSASCINGTWSEVNMDECQPPPQANVR